MVVLTLQYVDAHDRTDLYAWHTGGSRSLVNVGHDPFFYALHRPDPGRYRSWDRVKGVYERPMRMLSNTGIGRTVFRVVTRRSYDVPTVSKEVVGEGRIPCYENHVYYKNRFIIDRGVAHDANPPVFLSFDLEVMPPDEFGFPSSHRDPIISIAARASTGERMKWSSLDDELLVIEGFRAFFARVNPDVVVTFYGDLFDYPYLLARMKHWNVPDFMSRIPGIGVTKVETKNRTTWEIPGRCNFDLQYEVNADQKLFGLKNRGLKSISDHFFKKGVIQHRCIELPEGIYRAVQRRGIDAIGEYNLADADCTLEIAVGVYYPNVITLATEVLKCDLQSAVWRTPYWFSETLLARRMERAGILCDGSNADRFPSIFEFIDYNEQEYNIRPGGALVSLLRRGVVRRGKKFDFSSMYPSIIVRHNLSPETIHYEGITKDVDYPGWYARYLGEDETSRTVEIYDHKLRCIWKVSIDKEKGVLPAYEEELMALRKKEKKEKAPGWETREWAYKVAGNSMFGAQRLSIAQRGNVLVSICIMGFGRQHMTEALSFVVQAGANPVEIDTDGVYFDGLEDHESVLRQINESLPITMAFDGAFDFGLFYKAKNYILLKESGDMMLHGIALKGTNKPRMCDRVVRHLAGILAFDGNPFEYVRRLSLKDFEPADFMVSGRLNKDVMEYKSNHPIRRLAQQLMHRGQSVAVGDELTFFWSKVGGKSEPIPASDWHSGQHAFDMDKYAELLGKAVARVLGTALFPCDSYDKLDKKGQKNEDRPINKLAMAVRDYLLEREGFSGVVDSSRRQTVLA